MNKFLKNNKYGLSYFYIHFIVEIVCFYVMGNYLSFDKIFFLSLLYDFLAFVPQELIGYLYDKKIKFNYFIFGFFLLVISIMFLYFNMSSFVTITFLALGNALIHVCGVEKTIRGSKGQMTPSSLFVAGGSFGLITGKILAMFNCPIIIIIFICLTMIIPYYLFCRNDLLKEDNLKYYDFDNNKINKTILIIFAVFVVAIRAYIGYGIPTSWNKTLLQNIILYSFMGIGKALGGVLIDNIGIRKTVYISTLCSLPFLIFGDNLIFVSLIGVMLFSTTMSITLAILVSSIKKPGIAFGLTTIGLFLGSFPLFIFRINDIIINIIIIVVLSLVCLIFLLKITKRKGC